MNREQEMVREWHQVAGRHHPYPDTPTVELARCRLRYSLIQEELFELDDAMDDGNLVEVADALGDLLFVVYGTAVEYGIDLEPVFAEICRSNMSKVNPETGEVELRPDGKILKGPWFSPPDLAPILEAQGA